MIKLYQLRNPTILSLIRRPSAKIKSPYVSDGILDNQTYTIHTPALNMGGQCIEGTKLICDKSYETSKTDYIVNAIELEEENYKNIYIGANPFIAEKIAKIAIQKNCIQYFKNFTFTKKPNSIKYTGDIYGELKGKTHIIEIKNVICATYDPKIDIISPSAKFYDHSAPFSRSGIYPFGNKTQKWNDKKVVSYRSIRQIDEMIKIIKNDNDIIFTILFIVNRSDCNAFRPNWASDPVYCNYLLMAKDAGVNLQAVKMHWDDKSCYYHSQLKIELDKW
tara:strand:- start:3933 stop:4763 length:831 start_codon:yes stop_codon:yes gene_type:complete